MTIIDNESKTFMVKLNKRKIQNNRQNHKTITKQTKKKYTVILFDGWDK